MKKFDLRVWYSSLVLHGSNYNADVLEGYIVGSIEASHAILFRKYI